MEGVKNENKLSQPYNYSDQNDGDLYFDNDSDTAHTQHENNDDPSSIDKEVSNLADNITTIKVDNDNDNDSLNNNVDIVSSQQDEPIVDEPHINQQDEPPTDQQDEPFAYGKPPTDQQDEPPTDQQDEPYYAPKVMTIAESQLPSKQLSYSSFSDGLVNMLPAQQSLHATKVLPILESQLPSKQLSYSSSSDGVEILAQQSISFKASTHSKSQKKGRSSRKQLQSSNFSIYECKRILKNDYGINNVTYEDVSKLIRQVGPIVCDTIYQSTIVYYSPFEKKQKIDSHHGSSVKHAHRKLMTEMRNKLDTINYDLSVLIQNRNDLVINMIQEGVRVGAYDDYTKEKRMEEDNVQAERAERANDIAYRRCNGDYKQPDKITKKYQSKKRKAGNPPPA